MYVRARCELGATRIDLPDKADRNGNGEPQGEAGKAGSSNERAVSRALAYQHK